MFFFFFFLKWKHLSCWKTVKSVLHTTNNKCHGKREIIMVRVKLNIPRVNFLHVEVLWECFPICFSCLAPWSLARAPERRCFTVPTPVHRLHFLILPVETPRIGTTGETDRQAAPCCGPSLDCIRLKEIMYTLCFFTVIRILPFSLVFPLPPPCATLPLAWRGKKNIHRWVFAPSPAARRA